MKIYLVGSLKNPFIADIGTALRSLGHDVFDDWHAGGPNADKEWERYSRQRGQSYAQALHGRAAENAFNFDMRHLADCDMGVIVLPAGKSAHLEIGWLLGTGRPAVAYFSREPDGWDLMYKMLDRVFFDEADLLQYFRSR